MYILYRNIIISFDIVLDNFHSLLPTSILSIKINYLIIKCWQQVFMFGFLLKYLYSLSIFYKLNFLVTIFFLNLL